MTATQPEKGHNERKQGRNIILICCVITVEQGGRPNKRVDIFT